jgi:hypothetical protein
MRAKLSIVLPLVLVAAIADPAQAMVRHVAFFAPPVSLELFDQWYFGTHAQECIRFFGPWLRRYETYRSVAVPDEANRFNVYRGRYTELWYEDVEAFREAAPNSRPYTPSAWGSTSTREQPTVRLLVPAMPTEDFLGKEPTPQRRPFLRWLVAVRYPGGVSEQDGERWYLGVHTQEQKRMPGLLRFVSYKAVANSPMASPWVRISELWFQDYAAWRAAVLTTSIQYTPPSWARGNRPWIETASTFIGYEPDMDFLAFRSRTP